MEEKKEMTIVELKAYAYDLIAQIQVYQNELNAVNQKINEKLQEKG